MKRFIFETAVCFAAAAILSTGLGVATYGSALTIDQVVPIFDASFIAFIGAAFMRVSIELER